MQAEPEGDGGGGMSYVASVIKMFVNMNSVKAHDRRPHKFSCDSSGIVAIAIEVFVGKDLCEST